GNAPKKNSAGRRSRNRRRRSTKRCCENVEPMFVDRIKVLAQAGNGGRGCVSFRREKFVPKGGPDGGDGGRGGDVILRADVHVDNLSNLFYEPIIKAKNGGHGQGKKMHGRGAVPKIVKVPVGTVVFRDDTDRSDKTQISYESAPVADLT